MKLNTKDFMHTYVPRGRGNRAPKQPRQGAESGIGEPDDDEEYLPTHLGGGAFLEPMRKRANKGREE